MNRSGVLADDASQSAPSCITRIPDDFDIAVTVTHDRRPGEIEAGMNIRLIPVDMPRAHVLSKYVAGRTARGNLETARLRRRSTLGNKYRRLNGLDQPAAFVIDILCDALLGQALREDLFRLVP